MDEMDRKILEQLQENGRLSLSDLANKIGLSSPSTGERVKKLEQQGIISGYRAMVDPESIGLTLLAFIAVTIEQKRNEEKFLSVVMKTEEVLECHHIAGEDSYLLKVRCRNTRHLEHLISNSLKSLPGVTRTRTTISLSTRKETTALSLDETEYNRNE